MRKNSQKKILWENVNLKFDNQLSACFTTKSADSNTENRKALS